MKLCFSLFLFLLFHSAKASRQCLQILTSNNTNQLIASATSIMIVVHNVDVLCVKRKNRISEQMKNWLNDITRGKTNLIQVIEWKRRSDCHLFVRTIYHFHIFFLFCSHFLAFNTIFQSLFTPLSFPFLSIPFTFLPRLVVSVANTSESI